MVTRRELSYAIMLLLMARASLVPIGVARAQQDSDKPKLKLSEVREAARAYVDGVSNYAKETMGVEFSAEQKRVMVNNIISGIEIQGTYAFIDP